MSALAADGVVAKSVFAGLINVSPGRVSQYIAEGKLHGEALVGEGRGAQIRVEVAKAQLRRKLDIDQRHGNGISTRLEPSPSLPFTPQGPLPAPPPVQAVDAVEEKIKQERLEALQRQNRKALEDELARAGRYVSAEQVTQQMGRIASDMVAMFESLLPDIAIALSAKFPIPQRDVLHLMRTEFRASRLKQSNAMKQSSQALPEMLVEEPETVEPA